MLLDYLEKPSLAFLVKDIAFDKPFTGTSGCRYMTKPPGDDEAPKLSEISNYEEYSREENINHRCIGPPRSVKQPRTQRQRSIHCSRPGCQEMEAKPYCSSWVNGRTKRLAKTLVQRQECERRVRTSRRTSPYLSFTQY